MSDLESKLPEYILQPNAISRAIYDMSTNARRLIGMAMALIPPNAEKPADYRVKFSVSEFEKALGLPKGKKSREIIIAAVRECLDSHIEIFLPNGDWKGWSWFVESCLEFELNYIDRIELDHIPIVKGEDCNYNCWSNIVMEFNYHLGETLKQFKRAYSEIRLENLGRLQSKYAIRYYEIAQSFAGFAGKDGNPPNTWYFDYSIMEIRTIFSLAKSKYRVVNEFRRNVVDKPIAELNSSDIGLHITVEYVRRGRKLVGFRFVCRHLANGDAKPANKTTQDDLDEDALIEQYKDIYQAAYDEEYNSRTKEALFADHPVLAEQIARQKGIDAIKDSLKPAKKPRGQKSGKTTKKARRT